MLDRKEEPRKIEPVDTGKIPLYRVLAYRWDWVEGYRRVQELQNELTRLNAEYADVASKPVTAEDMLEIVKKHYDEYMRNRLFVLSKVFQGYTGEGNPFKFFGRSRQYQGQAIPGYVSWSEVEAIFKNMGGKMTQAKKQKKLAEIKKKIEETQAEIQKSETQEFATNRGDARGLLVEFWQRLQGLCRDEVSIEGYELAYADKSEQAAYQALGIGDSINPEGGLPR